MLRRQTVLGPGRHATRAWIALGATLVLVLSGFVATASPAVAKKKTKANTTAVTLATLKPQAPLVQVKAKGKKSFKAAKSGQGLKQGDEIRTDAQGKAEINYIDGSLTRLGPSTDFTLSKLTNKRGGRQTQGTLNVGETWNRAAKLSETSSFEVKAGGTTASVEGTAFAVVCTATPAGLSCKFIDVLDQVNVTTPSGALASLLSGTEVIVDGGQLGNVLHLSFDDLNGDQWILQNLLLDQQEGKGNGLGDLPAPTTTTTTTTTAPPNPGGGGGGLPLVSQDVTPGGTQYPPTGGGITVENPTVGVGGEVAFSGTGCIAGETLQVLWDGQLVGTLLADGQGNFAGHITIPVGTAPGLHTLTVRGSQCVFSATISVLGASLARTGASNHTVTYVFSSLAAIAVGLVLVVGTRRRRRVARRT
jgi:hypothetical protein